MNRIMKGKMGQVVQSPIPCIPTPTPPHKGRILKHTVMLSCPSCSQLLQVGEGVGWRGISESILN